MNKSILKHFYFTIISFIVCLAIILSISVFKNDNSSCSNVKNYSSLTYTALGDSITRGSYNKVQMENPYPILVGKELNFANTINLGVSGYTFCENGKWGSIITKLKSIPYESNIISVMGGTNDYAQNKPIGTIADKSTNTIYGSINYIATTLKNNYPNSFLFFMTALPLSDAKTQQYSSSETSINEINSAIKEVANLHNILVLDTYSLSNFESEMNNTELSDGCHPTPEFHKNNLTPLVVEFIKNNYHF